MKEEGRFSKAIIGAVIEVHSPLGSVLPVLLQ